jgi:UDP-glucuronate 4-epimerase
VSRVLVTGAAGFIGFHFCRALLAAGREVVGMDDLNPYYDLKLKEDRLRLLVEDDRFEFHRADIADRAGMEEFFAAQQFETVVNLAAQAGVRYSLTNPHAYVQANVVGFLNVLEGCRASGVKHLLYASSSSVYGGNTKLPFAVTDNVDHPLSLYAATKKSNELMAHVYSHLFGLPTTGLRFFTVYGPWGRPDMAIFKFTRAILAGEPIDVYNHGDMRRDFTYVDDIVTGMVRLMDRIPTGEEPGDFPESLGSEAGSATGAPCALYNIGNNSPVELMHVIRTLESQLGHKAEMNLLPMQPGDVPATYADVDDLIRDVGFRPDTAIENGIAKFVEWYLEYYGESRVER